MEYSAEGIILKHSADPSLEALEKLNTLLIIVHTKTKISTFRTFKQFVCFCRDSPQWATASSLTRFLYHTQQRTTVGRPPLDE